MKCRSVEQRSRMFALLSQDCNGHWKEGNTQSPSRQFQPDEGDAFWYTYKDFYCKPNGVPNGFKKKIFCISSHRKSTVPTEDFAVVQYTWKGRSVNFETGLTYTSRLVTKALKDRAAPVARGQSVPPRELYISQLGFTSPDDLAINPLFGPTGVRQSTNMKNLANRAVFSKAPEEYLRTMRGVLLRQFQDVDGTKYTNYILVDPYQIGLIGEVCKNKYKCKLYSIVR